MNSDSLPLTANVNDQAEELTRAFCEFQSQPADHWRRASFRKTFRIMLEHDRYEFGDIMTVIAHLRSLESYIDDSRYQFAFDLRREYRRLHEQVVDLLNARGAAPPRPPVPPPSESERMTDAELAALPDRYARIRDRQLEIRAAGRRAHSLAG